MAESTARRRGNGEGYLKHDPTRDRWRGAVAWTEPDGTPRRRAFSGKRQADVRRRMDELRAELAAGHAPASTRTVADYLAGWLEAERARVRPATWRYRDSHARNYIIPALGSVKLAELTPRHVEHMTAEMLAGRHPVTAPRVARPLSARTAVGVRVSLRKALGDAVRDGLIHRNVAALARPARIPGREVEYLTRDELRRLLEACEGQPMGPLVTLAATTGLRQGELLGLAWADVDMDAATLTVRHAMARSWDGWAVGEVKTTRSRRTIHLPARATAALRAQLEAQEAARTAAGDDWQDVDGLVFTDAIGRPLHGWNAAQGFDRLLERAKLRHVPFHALRHSWATLALASGVPLKVVADNLGHASIAVTASFYSGIVPELNRDAADAIGRALA
jgi:integrase